MQMNESPYHGWIILLKILVVIFILTTFTGFWFVHREENYDNQYYAYTEKIGTLLERYARFTIEFIDAGEEESYTALVSIRDEISKFIDILTRGQEDKVGKIILPPSPPSIQNKELARVSELWQTYKTYTDPIAANKNIVKNLYLSVKSGDSTLDKIQTNLLKVMNSLAPRRDISGSDYELITQMFYVIQTMSEGIQSMQDPQINVEKIAKELPKAMDAFQMGLTKMKARFKGDAVNPTLFDIEKDFLTLKDKVNDLIEMAKNLQIIYNSWELVRTMSPDILSAISVLEQAYLNFTDSRPFNNTTIIILSIVTFFLVILLMFLLYKEQQYILRASETEIKMLVEDLKDLSSGNLRVRANIGSGISSAIAKAINYSVDALRLLVINVNQTSQKVSNSVNEIGKIMQQLVQSSRYQTNQVVNVGTTVSIMTSTLDQMSADAKHSVEIAKNSVDISVTGAAAVHDTISGMERIRQQIEETEKRMQRLHDSSAEIGEIVSIMDDISERTNILALNAAIQAAMVGEAGMGFAIVADEVQMLAVKSSQAVKQVETVVSTIRTDANRATKAMELAISEVYTGTKLANNAGSALQKVEMVSKELAEIVQSISNSADEQTKIANKISKTMEIIESIARQTSSGSITTEEAIERLAVLMQSLHDSVSEFKV